MITAAQRDAWVRVARHTVLRVEPGPDGRALALLDDSILYAEGGGQPFDLGTVGGVSVLAVRKAEGGVLHELAGPVPTGEAEVVLDWARRFDHMQQHTAQHLLSAIAQDEFGLKTTSFHLQVGPEARCDVELDGDLPDARALEERINEEVRAARAVRAIVVDEVPPTARSRGVPDGIEGAIRLVEIDGLDQNTCGGTHVRSTAELQAVSLLGTERVRGGTRVYYVAGGRVLSRLALAEARLAEASGLLSRGAADLADGIRRVLDDAKAASRARQATADELAELLGARLAGEAGVRVMHRAEGDVPFLNRVATEVLRRDPGATVLLTAEPDLFLVAAPPERIGAVKAQVLAALEAKGGGPPGRLQGKGRIERRAEVERLLAGDSTEGG